MEVKCIGPRPPFPAGMTRQWQHVAKTLDSHDGFHPATVVYFIPTLKGSLPLELNIARASPPARTRLPRLRFSSRERKCTNLRVN